MPLQCAAARFVAAPSPATEARVLALLEPKLVSLCSRLLHRLPSDDQLQDARVAALCALRTYDVTRSRFSSYLGLEVKKALYRNRNHNVRLPEYLLRRLGRLDALTAEYLLEHDRAPTNEEIALALLMPLESVPALHRAAVLLTGADDADQLGADPTTAIHARLDIEAAFEALHLHDPKAAQVARLRLLDNHTNQAIAQILRICRDTVDKRLARAREFLQTHLAEYA